MSQKSKKTAIIVITVSMSMILVSTIYAVNSIGGLSITSHTEYPTVIVDGIAPRKVLGVVVDKSLTVLRIEPGSAAEQAGLEVGDILVELNGKSVKSVDDVKKEVSEVVVELPTDSPESAKLSQEIKDATTVAYIESQLAKNKKDMDKISVGVEKKDKTKVTKDIDKKSQVGTADATPTPVASDDFYF